MKHWQLAILLGFLAFLVQTYLENIGYPHWTQIVVLLAAIVILVSRILGSPFQGPSK